MITVIKHGKETFKVTCPVCGCEFTYQAEDLTLDMFGNHNVICPDCHQIVPHDEPKKKGLQKQIIQDDGTYPSYPNVIWTTTTPSFTNWPDCATCPNRPDPNKPATVGDTPCTWCIKNRPYCNTQTVKGYTFPKEYYTYTGPVPDVCLNKYVPDPEFYKNTKVTGYTTPYHQKAVKLDTNYTTDLK